MESSQDVLRDQETPPGRTGGTKTISTRILHRVSARKFTRLRRELTEQNRETFNEAFLSAIDRLNSDDFKITKGIRGAYYEFWRSELVDDRIWRRTRTATLIFFPLLIALLITTFIAVRQDSPVTLKDYALLSVAQMSSLAFTFLGIPIVIAIKLRAMKFLIFLIPLASAVASITDALTKGRPVSPFPSNIKTLSRVDYVTIYFLHLQVILATVVLLLFALVIVRDKLIFHRAVSKHWKSIVIARSLQLAHAIETDERQIRRRSESLEVPLSHLASISFALRNGSIRDLKRIGLNSVELAILQPRFMEAASQVDAYRLWLSFPREDTYRQVVDKLLSLGFALAAGNLDYLPRRESDVNVRPTRLKMAASFVKTLAIAFTPIALLLIMGWVGLSMQGAFRDAAIVISLCWTAIVLLSAIDPLLKDRISTTSDIISLFRGSK